MRAPQRAFRNRLEEYKRDYLKFSKDPPHVRPIALQILSDWMDHPDCDKIWDAVDRFLKVKVTPERFIVEVLRAAIDAEKLKLVHSALPGLGDKAAKHTKKDWREGLALQARHYVVSEQKERVLGREGTGPRVNFLRELSAGFERWCGKPLDKEVAALTEITFGESVTPQAARSARKNRPTRPRTVGR